MQIESSGTDDLEDVPEEVSQFDGVPFPFPVAEISLDKSCIAGACLKRFSMRVIRSESGRSSRERALAVLFLAFARCEN